MRIKGLVSAFNHIRLQLQTGIRPEEVERFRQRVKTVVRDVEEICRRHGTTPDRLPAPSRMAYVFLKDLNLDNLPVNRSGKSASRVSVLKVKNVVKIGDHFAGRLWHKLDLILSSPGERDQTKGEMIRHVSSIERLCELHGVTPSALETPSRQTYCWLKFLTSEDNLTLHLDTLSRARDVVRGFQHPPGSPIHLHLTVMNALWRMRQYQNALLIKVNEGFLYADQNVLRAILQNSISKRRPDNDHLIHEYAVSDDFGELLIEIESFAAPPALPAQGRAHNLDVSFDRVNGAYFGGRMARPNLVWNRALTMRRFGHYQPSRDTLMVSISLDDPGVPGFVIDFVIYHELLHKKHGAATVNGRRQTHSPSFRADERQFAEYVEATRHITKLALKQRGLGERRTAADSNAGNT